MSVRLVTSNDSPRVDVTERFAEHWQIEAQDHAAQESAEALMWSSLAAAYLVGIFSGGLLFAAAALIVDHVL